MQSRGTKGLLSSLRINCADYVGFPPELLALVYLGGVATLSCYSVIDFW